MGAGHQVTLTHHVGHRQRALSSVGWVNPRPGWVENPDKEARGGWPAAPPATDPVGSATHPLAMNTAPMKNSEPGQRSRAGKYLTFVLGQESYGVDVLKIREIIRPVDITSVPQMPAYVCGVINLRGKIVPVVDLRIKFGLEPSAATERSCIVVVQVRLPSGGISLMGLIVDAVEEVLNISEGDIEETPDFGTTIDTDYILGMAKVKGAVKTILDIDKVVSADVIKRIPQA